MELRFDQGCTHTPLEVNAFTEEGPVDFPSQFPGGVTLHMTSGTVTITGAAAGDASGNLVYAWAAHDLDVAGSYTCYFLATDGAGRTAKLPKGTTFTIVVVAL